MHALVITIVLIFGDGLGIARLTIVCVILGCRLGGGRGGRRGRRRIGRSLDERRFLLLIDRLANVDLCDIRVRYTSEY